eukprot:4965641-Pleurochrysis_carterae.AAC.1
MTTCCGHQCWSGRARRLTVALPLPMLAVDSVNLLKNARVGDMPGYNAKQLLGSQVVGAFALD